MRRPTELYSVLQPVGADTRQTVRLLHDIGIRVYGTPAAPGYAPPAPGIEITHRHGKVALSAAGDLCEVRDKITELRKALTGLEALLDRSEERNAPPAPLDEFVGYSPEAKAGILHIRELSDETVLDAARDRNSDTFAQILEFMGPATNPYWITSQCATEAYMRGVMEATEMDRIVDA
jgi:hypothetical protein